MGKSRMRNRELLMRKESKSCLRNSINPNKENLLYSSGFKAQKYSCDEVARVH